MKIGIDITSLAFKKQVDQIILIAGDTDALYAQALWNPEFIMCAKCVQLCVFSCVSVR